MQMVQVIWTNEAGHTVDTVGHLMEYPTLKAYVSDPMADRILVFLSHCSVPPWTTDPVPIPSKSIQFATTLFPIDVYAKRHPESITVPLASAAANPGAADAGLSAPPAIDVPPAPAAGDTPSAKPEE